ncbi:MAG: BON domain-containing protein [Thermoguttaceae bacterium]|nr:BON domain-containing protein [Thermoguttaceae bacterium]
MRRLFVPVFFGLVIALGVSSAQAGNQEEANKIAQRLTQQYPQYNIEVAYQEGKVRLRGEVGSEAEKAEIANFVRRIPKVRSVSETMTVSNYVQAAPATQYAEPFGGIRSVQALTPATPALPATPVAPAAAPAASVEYEYAGAPIGVPAEATVVGAPGAVRSPSDFFAPQGAATVAAQNGQPNLPNYAWPSYADYPNYSQVAYPKQYAANAFPYIGPFYPYPQVPMGWRKVTMEWHDGYWWLDFNDGSQKGPFSPLFRQPSSYRK